MPRSLGDTVAPLTKLFVLSTSERWAFFGPRDSPSPAVDTSKIKTSCCAAMSLVSLFFGAYPLPRLRVRVRPLPPPYLFPRRNFSTKRKEHSSSSEEIGNEGSGWKVIRARDVLQRKRARQISPDGRRAGIERWEGIEWGAPWFGVQLA